MSTGGELAAVRLMRAAAEERKARNLRRAGEAADRVMEILADEKQFRKKTSFSYVHDSEESVLVLRLDSNEKVAKMALSLVKQRLPDSLEATLHFGTISWGIYVSLRSA